MSPVAMQFAGVVYPLMFLVVAWVVFRRATAAGLGQDTTILFVVSSAVGAVIGARAFFLIATGSLFSSPIAGWMGVQGTASWGAYLGALSGALAYGLCASRPTAIFVDALASCAALGSFIGRWSCLLYGDDFGKPSTLPWAIRFPQGSLPFQAQVAEGALERTAAWSLPVHPMQLYLMAVAFLVFIGTTWYWARFRHVSWSTLGVYFLLEGSLRLPVEFFRAPAAGGSLTFGSTSQIMCLLFLVAGSTILMVIWSPRLWNLTREDPSVRPG